MHRGLYPERIGAETARYYRGQPAVSLRQPTGTIEVRPVRVEKGKAMFALAVFNEGAQAANFGIENILASVNAIPVGLPTYQQLVADAEDKARGARIGTMLAAGALAGPRPPRIAAPMSAMSAVPGAATPE